MFTLDVPYNQVAQTGSACPSAIHSAVETTFPDGNYSVTLTDFGQRYGEDYKGTYSVLIEKKGNESVGDFRILIENTESTANPKLTLLKITKITDEGDEGPEYGTLQSVPLTKADFSAVVEWAKKCQDPKKTAGLGEQNYTIAARLFYDNIPTH